MYFILHLTKQYVTMIVYLYILLGGKPMKRKLLYLLICISVLICCFSITAFAGFDLSENDIISMDKVESLDECLATGDVDGDGVISAGDARIILRISVNLDEIDASNFVKADLDGDGKITAQDARISLRLSVGLDKLPEHKLEEIVVVPATCSTDGLTVRICTRCLKLYASVTVPASNNLHITAGWTTVKMPTCIESGLAQKICVACSAVVKEVELPATNEHSGEWNYPNGKSCLDPVKKNRTCTVCGTFEEVVENPIGHHDFRWVTVEKNTCTTDGSEVYKCSHCETESKIQVTKAHGHLYERNVVVTKPTCTLPGVKGDKCVYCDDVINSTAISALGHSYDNKHYKVTLEPTCSSTGTADVVCSVCGDAREIVLPKTEHTLTQDWNITTPASCTEKGLAEGVCRFCGDVTKEIPANGHTVAKWENVNTATCTQEGLKTGYCSVCNNPAAQEVIPKLPHNYDEKVIYHVSGVLCKEDGEGYVKCTACGDKKYGKILCLGKCVADNEIHVKSEATCTENKKTVDVCKYCEEEIAGTERTVFGTKLGHDWSSWSQTKDPTCSENGKSERSCSRCSETQDKPIAATGHVTKDWEVEREATCSQTGLKKLVCTECGKTVRTSESSKTAHTPKNIVIADSATVTPDGHYVVKCKVECSVCHTTISESETVTRIEVDSDIALTFEDGCDVTPGGSVYFTLADSSSDVIVSISYGIGNTTILEDDEGMYMFTIPDTISDSEKILITVYKVTAG